MGVYCCWMLSAMKQQKKGEGGEGRRIRLKWSFSVWSSGQGLLQLRFKERCNNETLRLQSRLLAPASPKAGLQAAGGTSPRFLWGVSGHHHGKGCPPKAFWPVDGSLLSKQELQGTFLTFWPLSQVPRRNSKLRPWGEAFNKGEKI